MRPLRDVLSDVRPEHPLEVSRTGDQEVVEALTAHSSHEPLREGVCPRRADRRSDDPDALGADDRVERPTEPGVPVAQEEPHTRQPLADGKVPRLLGDPRRVRMCRDTVQVHAPCRELDEEQDVEGLAADRLDGEEVGRKDPRRR